MTYAESRPSAYLLDTDGQGFLYTKSQGWEYEKEWRIICNFGEAAQKVGPDSNGKDVLLFAIPPDCIRGVVAGYRATKESVQDVRSMVALNSALAHVPFSTAVLKENGQIEIVRGG